MNPKLIYCLTIRFAFLSLNQCPLQENCKIDMKKGAKWKVPNVMYVLHCLSNILCNKVEHY